MYWGLLDLASGSCVGVEAVAVSLVDRSPGDVRNRISLTMVSNWLLVIFFESGPDVKT